MPLYRVAKGTICRVREKRDPAWRPWVTTQDLVFHRGVFDRKAATWEFKRGKWRLLVPAARVRTPSNDRTPPLVRPPGSPLLTAHARSLANDRPVSDAGGVSAPGSGTDDWREQD